MRYLVNALWPARGGAAVIPANTIIDTELGPYSDEYWSRAIPPWNVTPLDEATRDWLVAAYRGHPVSIPAVEAE